VSHQKNFIKRADFNAGWKLLMSKPQFWTSLDFRGLKNPVATLARALRVPVVAENLRSLNLDFCKEVRMPTPKRQCKPFNRDCGEIAIYPIIELRLRAMQFSADDSFLPTAAHVVLMEEAPEQFDVAMRIRRLPGYATEEYEYLGYPIRKLCEILGALLQTAQNT
jgi:hypothetical protein